MVFLEPVPGRFNLQDVSRLESCTPLPDFAVHICIKPRFLVGKNTDSPGGDADGGAPVDVAAKSAAWTLLCNCVFLSLLLFLEYGKGI